MAEFILKDWYGKEQTFDKETIYVQGKDGGLVPFTQGAGNPVIEPLEVTENGTYEVPNGVDGYNPVTVNVEKERNTLLFDNSNLSGFASDSEFGGLYTRFQSFGSNPFEILLDQEYLVVWDNVPFSVYGKDAGDFYPGAMYLGNGTLMGLEGNNEPFIIACIPTGIVFVSTDNKSSHSVTLMKRVRPEELRDVILQDITITENGEYTADPVFDGIGKVTVEVAGSGGGLLETPIVASGTFIPTSVSSFTVNHNLGVVPDCIEIQNVNASSGTVAATRILYAIGFRTGLLFGGSNQSAVLTSSSGGGAIWTGGNAGIDGSNSYCPFKNANETSVKIGSAIQKLEVNTEYTWIAKRLLA